MAAVMEDDERADQEAAAEERKRQREPKGSAERIPSCHPEQGEGNQGVGQLPDTGGAAGVLKRRDDLRRDFGGGDIAGY